MTRNAFNAKRRHLVKCIVGTMMMSLGFPTSAAVSQQGHTSKELLFTQFMKLSERLTGIKELDPQQGRLILLQWQFTEGQDAVVKLLEEMLNWANNTPHLHLKFSTSERLSIGIKRLVSAWYLPSKDFFTDLESSQNALLSRNALIWKSAGVQAPGVPKGPKWWKTSEHKVVDG